LRAIFFLLALALTRAAYAPAILEARYDPALDRIVADIAYRGTSPDHEFFVRWGRCSDATPPRVTGRLIDRQGNDAAREDHRVREELELADIPCRPALVTLRLGPVQHARVFVPRDIDGLGNAYTGQEN
jgi:hypothetical protein